MPNMIESQTEGDIAFRHNYNGLSSLIRTQGES